MDAFRASLVDFGISDITDKDSINDIKEEISFKDSDWLNVSKVAELGGSLGATHVAVGQLTKRENAIFISVKIVAVEKMKVIASHSDKLANIEDFFNAMPEFCKTLISKTSNDSFAFLSSNNSPPVVYDEYKIGDEGPGGGIIFYVSQEGFEVYDGMGGVVLCHYFEMSKKTLGESAYFPEKMRISVKIDGSLGYGKANTYEILHQRVTSKSLTEKNCAAYRASKYFTTSTKAGDWWLPSKAELNLMYENLRDFVLDTSNDKYYWSSTEDGEVSAWNQDIASGERSSLSYKHNNYFSVRAVRAF